MLNRKFPDRFVDSLFTIDDNGEVVGHGALDPCRLPKHIPGFY
jgi:hypothetical protein